MFNSIRPYYLLKSLQVTIYISQRYKKNLHMQLTVVHRMTDADQSSQRHTPETITLLKLPKLLALTTVVSTNNSCLTTNTQYCAVCLDEVAGVLPDRTWATSPPPSSLFCRPAGL